MARRVRRGVKARRVVRRFELWSVAKLALVFHLFCYALTVAVLVVLWNVAFRLGTITKLETFLSDFGFSDKVSKQDFRLHGDAIFRAGTMAGLGLVALNTLATVLLAFFYNGVSGLFGGVVVSVLEERPPLSPAERCRPTGAASGSHSLQEASTRSPVSVCGAGFGANASRPRKLRQRRKRRPCSWRRLSSFPARNEGFETARPRRRVRRLLQVGHWNRRRRWNSSRRRQNRSRPRRNLHPSRLCGSPEQSHPTATRAQNPVPKSSSATRPQGYGGRRRTQTPQSYLTGTPIQRWQAEQTLRLPPACRAPRRSGPNAEGKTKLVVYSRPLRGAIAQLVRASH